MTAYQEDVKQRAVEFCRYYSIAYVGKHIGVERSVVSSSVKAAGARRKVPLLTEGGSIGLANNLSEACRKALDVLRR